MLVQHEAKQWQNSGFFKGEYVRLGKCAILGAKLPHFIHGTLKLIIIILFSLYSYLKE